MSRSQRERMRAEVPISESECVESVIGVNRAAKPVI